MQRAENVFLNTIPYVGIAPDLLLGQVENTAPVLFERTPESGEGFLQTLQGQRKNPKQVLSRPQYFRLCISAHFATVATFVPTDVDQTIRLKLWHGANADEVEAMIESVLDFLDWSDRLVSKRQVRSSKGSELSGHSGEWFSIAVPAWICAQKLNLPLADRLLETIQSEIQRHEYFFSDLLSKGASLALLKTSTLIAHNLGDLDRVIDMWGAKDDDPLKSIFKLGQNLNKTYPSLFAAGELNREMMASENHRHFALRKPRCLRKSSDLSIGMGPFFDEWGECIAKYPDFSEEELGEIAEALLEGFLKLNQTEKVVGYARALSGMLKNIRGGQATLLRNLPAAKRKQIESGELRSLISVSKESFEASWIHRASKFLKNLTHKLE
ncbi:MAG: hypothetical protein JWQ35_1827 [Bacteriovoracaceae bacterium]|nr:hypothetical protein [Bacteriovoracaceae bacterium]